MKPKIEISLNIFFRQGDNFTFLKFLSRPEIRMILNMKNEKLKLKVNVVIELTSY